MRTFLCVMLVAGGLARPAAAQQGPLPNLVFTIYGGTYTGHALWSVDRQTLQVLGTSQHDTIMLSRRVGAGLGFGVGGDYYWSSAIGIHADFAFLGLSLDNRCEGIFYNPDFEQKNQQTCNSINGSGASLSAVSGTVGLTARLAGRRSLSPYVRGGIGFLTYANSTIAVSGAFATASGVFVRDVYVDSLPKRTSFSVALGVGINAKLSPAYHFRFEVSDVLAPLHRVTGAANALGLPPTGSKVYHHLGITLGFGIVLEKQRGRRY